MHKSVLYIAASLDGFIAGKNDDISWLFRYNDVDYGYDGFLSTIGAIIQGRRTYEVEAEHGWGSEITIPVFVLSRRPPEREPGRPNIIFTDADLAEVLEDAKRRTDKDIWIEGGASVAQQFLARGLIDEIVLSVVPVILGDGVRLFGKTDAPVELTLREVNRFDKGLVQLTYTRD
jgi:dihydrofolate reductase